MVLVLKVRAEVEPGMLDLSLGDLRFITGEFGFLALHGTPDARARIAVMEPALAIYCKKVMKKRICT